MKKLCYLTLVTLMIIATGCSMMGQGKSQTLIGTWTGEMPQMGTITMTFRDDMTCLTVLDGSMAMEMEGKYTVDYSADPVTLDQFDFEDSMMGDMRYESIVKFVDGNTIMLAGNPDTQGGRPTDFNNSFEMKRK